MEGVERLMVVQHPLASNPEDAQGPGIMQQTSDFLQSYNITPEVALVSAGVGFAMEPGVRGPIKGALLGSLLSLLVNTVARR